MNCYDEEYQDLTPYEEELMTKVYNLELRVAELEKENDLLLDRIEDLLPVAEGD